MVATGELLLVIIKSAVELGQAAPLLTVHLNTFAPIPKPVTDDVGLVALVIVPVPLTSVHVPVPTVGVFPDKVAVPAQVV
jgi:hypothetical protein